MTTLDRTARANKIGEILETHFPSPAIPLDHGDPFQLLVAVILSAQCTDARVNLVTPALFARAPDAQTMAMLTPAQILPFIQSCGLAPGKAKALAGMARILVDNHGGEVPRDMAELEALPGVGHKTASVVMAQAFGVPAFPVDTHIHKLAKNLGFTRRNDLSWRTTEEITYALAAFDEADPVKYDFALCHMGMLQRCPSRRDAEKCEGCGVKPVCRHWRRAARAPRRTLRLIEG